MSCHFAKLNARSFRAGRAVGVHSEGLVDMGDDIAGDEGAQAMMEMYEGGLMKPYM